MVEKCHPQLKDNGAKIASRRLHVNLFTVIKLKHLMISVSFSTEQALKLLFQGIDLKTVDFTPVLQMAAELFTHLGVACTYSSSVS
jgi:hypothetical protein